MQHLHVTVDIYTRNLFSVLSFYCCCQGNVFLKSNYENFHTLSELFPRVCSLHPISRATDFPQSQKIVEKMEIELLYRNSQNLPVVEKVSKVRYFV